MRNGLVQTAALFFFTKVVCKFFLQGLKAIQQLAFPLRNVALDKQRLNLNQ